MNRNGDISFSNDDIGLLQFCAEADLPRSEGCLLYTSHIERSLLIHGIAELQTRHLLGEEVLDIGSICYLDIIGGNQTGYHLSLIHISSIMFLSTMPLQEGSPKKSLQHWLKPSHSHQRPWYGNLA